MGVEFTHSNKEVIRQALEMFLVEAYNHIYGNSGIFKIRILEGKDTLEFVVETVPQ